MANGELANHERALGPNFAIGFKGDVHELHSADCPTVHDHAHGVGVVAAILGQHVGVGALVGGGEVVRLDDVDAGKALERAVLQRARATPVLVQELGVLGAQIELRRANEERAIRVWDVLLAGPWTSRLHHRLLAGVCYTIR